MDNQILLLAGSAASIGLLHTVTGPDHYLPFVAMARIGRWSARKTLIVTLLCGIGHVLSSVLLGVIGIGLGAMVFANTLEETRGEWAGWLLLGFGLAYTVWGLRRAYRNQPHAHLHAHADGTIHNHSHDHHADHTHPHVVPFAPKPPDAVEERMTPWVLFTLFFFGPCEPLIPFVMVPAAKHNWWGVAVVTAVFGLVTLATMTAIVMIGHRAAARLPVERLGRFSHAAAGMVVLGCGIAVKFGGL